MAETIRVLVTGGAGRLAAALAAASGEVSALPRSRLDITDPLPVERELAEGGYAVVVNAAGVTDLEAAEAIRTGRGGSMRRRRRCWPPPAPGGARR